MFVLDHARSPAPLRVAVRAERTRLGSPSGEGQTWEAEVYLWLDRRPNGEIYVRMDGGSTGRECFLATRSNIATMQSRCWVASEGGQGQDRVVVSTREMQRFFGSVGLVLSEAA